MVKCTFVIVLLTIICLYISSSLSIHVHLHVNMENENVAVTGNSSIVKHYSSSFLLSLRNSKYCRIPRKTRKILFQYQIRRPSNVNRRVF